MNAVAAKSVAEASENVYKKYEKQAQDFQRKMIKEYGKENVAPLKYDKNGKINERMVTGKEFVTSALVTVGSVSLAGVGASPLVAVMTPATKNQRGRDAADQAYYAARLMALKAAGNDPDRFYKADTKRTALYGKKRK